MKKSTNITVTFSTGSTAVQFTYGFERNSDHMEGLRDLAQDLGEKQFAVDFPGLFAQWDGDSTGTLEITVK